MSRIIRIGTRKSALALAQTELVACALRNAYPDICVEIVTKETIGDKILDKPLQDFGGKGVFVSEFEEAIQEERIDLAVHSAKDMPMDLAEGLSIVAVSGREDARDVLVTWKGREIPHDKKVRIGTSSPRRQLQTALCREQIWPGHGECVCEILRGNVQTRLDKLEQGLYDGIILAAAGLKRLGLMDSQTYEFLFLDPETFIPAGGQGIMAVEGKTDSFAGCLCQSIDNRQGRICLTLERRVLKLLDAGCHEPIGVYSVLKNDVLKVWGVSRKRGEVKKICLEGGALEEEIEALAQRAAKGLM